MEYLKIGKIINTFGIKGELKIKSYTDFDDERFAVGNEVFVATGGEYLKFKIRTYRVHKNNVLLSFEDMLDINKVEQYKNCDIYCDKTAIHELEEDEYYFFELEGMEVFSDEGEYIGKVIKVEEGVVQNLLRIRRENNETVLIPYVEAFIEEVDPEKNRITVHLIEGLL